jgi:serine/threonine-protein kinase RsbT
MGQSDITAIASQVDIECVRRAARALVTEHQVDRTDAECVVIAVSELATNLLHYAFHGEIEMGVVYGPRGLGIRIESRDLGPGIADVSRALRDGYSSGKGLGSGLPGVMRLMDDFAIDSGPAGTRITACKWTTPQS